MRARLAELRAAGLVEDYSPETLQLSPEGHKVAPAPPEGSVWELVRGQLGNASEAIVQWLLEIGGSATREQIAAAVSIELNGSTMRARLAELGVAARVVTRLSPPWTTDWMSDAAKAKLHAYGIAPPHTRPAPDVALLRLQLPANQRFQYHAGQYIEFILRDNSRRSYSMANAPHTLEVAAMWAVLTRLEPPKKSGLTLMQKMKLYNGKTLANYTEDNVKELRKEGRTA